MVLLNKKAWLGGLNSISKCGIALVNVYTLFIANNMATYQQLLTH